MSEKTTLLEMIQKASESDLQDIDEQIAARQVDLDKAKAEVNRLRSLRKTVNVIVNGKPERKKPTKKAASVAQGGGIVSSSSEERREAVAKHLAKHGATKPMHLCSELDIPDGSITFVLSCGAFAKTPNGYVLTPEGRSKYLES